MKILIVHNRYRQPGGEDEVFHREGELLRSTGHAVMEYVRDNHEISEQGLLNAAKLGMRTLWARESQRELRALLRREKPDLVHFHNTFPLISPAAYYACKDAGIPVVQSLHNARLICPAATFYREEKVCVDCLGKSIPWPGIIHGCYHDSCAQTSVIAGMITLHKLLRTWDQLVDAYIVPTEFYREKYVSAGFPQSKIFVKPHFLTEDPGMKRGAGGYALFLGRLAREKGVSVLLEAWRKVGHIPLFIGGQGPLEVEVSKLKQENSNVVTAPHLAPKDCFDLMKRASFLIWPSVGYYETFGLVAIEAFACGTPVIASRSGAMRELVGDKITGLQFEAGNPYDLAAKVQWAWNQPDEMEVMGRAARAEYESKYTAASNYEELMRIYRAATEAKASERTSEVINDLAASVPITNG